MGLEICGKPLSVYIIVYVCARHRVCIQPLTSRMMNSLESREPMLSRIPDEERVLMRNCACVLRELIPVLSWYLSMLSFSKDHSGRAKV